MTSIQQIHQAITSLGIEGSSVVVHSSLRSFGEMEGGTAKLIAVLKERFANVMMPAFSTTFITRPPLDDRPAQNGCDYDEESLWKLNASEPFEFQKVKIDSRMGKLVHDFSMTPGTIRSEHPWHGWAVAGEQAEEWTRNHLWTQTHPALERLGSVDGWVILMGVDFRSCTAIHLAEEKAGRKPFIRWARNSQGAVSRIRVSGCAKGFHHLQEPLEKQFKTIQVGKSPWMVARVKDLIDAATKLISQKPELTRCSVDCLRCRDAILGGPVLENI